MSPCLTFSVCFLLQAEQLASEADAVEEQQSGDHKAQQGRIVRLLSLSTLDVMADNTVRTVTNHVNVKVHSLLKFSFYVLDCRLS